MTPDGGSHAPDTTKSGAPDAKDEGQAPRGTDNAFAALPPSGWVLLALGVAACVLSPLLLGKDQGALVAAGLTAAVTLAYVVFTFLLIRSSKASADAARQAADAATTQASAANLQADAAHRQSTLLRQQVTEQRAATKDARIAESKRAAENDKLFRDGVRGRIDAAGPLVALCLNLEACDLLYRSTASDAWLPAESISRLSRESQSAIVLRLVIGLALRNYGAGPAVINSPTLPLEFDLGPSNTVPLLLGAGEERRIAGHKVMRAETAHHFAAQGGWHAQDGWTFNFEFTVSNLSGTQAVNLILPVDTLGVFTTDGTALVVKHPFVPMAPQVAYEKERSYPHLNIIEEFGRPVNKPDQATGGFTVDFISPQEEG